MTPPGLKTVHQVLRWLRSRAGSGALILGYHRVAAEQYDPFNMCIKPERFARQMAALREVAHPLSLSELVQGLRGGRLPSRAVAVTFDDGYHDVLAAAAPILRRHGIPATIFITTGNLGGRFWWDHLADTIYTPTQLPERLSITVNGRPFHWQRSEQSEEASDRNQGRDTLLRALYRRLRVSPGELADTLAALRRLTGLPEEGSNSGVRALTADEIQLLADNELFEIGAHTVNHIALDSADPEEQQREIVRSKEELEHYIRQPVTSFSYPHGRSTVATRVILRELGFSRACTSTNDVVRTGSDQFRLPRFWPGDWEAQQFSTWLQKWIVG